MVFIDLEGLRLCLHDVACLSDDAPHAMVREKAFGVRQGDVVFDSSRVMPVRAPLTVSVARSPAMRTLTF